MSLIETTKDLTRSSNASYPICKRVASVLAELQADDLGLGTFPEAGRSIGIVPLGVF